MGDKVEGWVAKLSKGDKVEGWVAKLKRLVDELL
jgi:hypothetical protein